MGEEFRREVKFRPAFDKTNKNPSKNYGVGAVIIFFTLIGEKGEVSFTMHTGWYQSHLKNTASMKDPEGWNLGYHSPKPLHKGQIESQTNCKHFNGNPCYSDGSILNARPLVKVLINEGDEGIWRELQKYYTDIFEPSTSGREKIMAKCIICGLVWENGEFAEGEMVDGQNMCYDCIYELGDTGWGTSGEKL